MTRAVRNTRREETPSWVRWVRWLWHEDDALTHDPGAERERDAWPRLFGEPFPGKHVRNADGEYVLSKHWLVCWDAGDADFLLDAAGRVWCSSYPGNSAIGLLVGHGVLISEHSWKPDPAPGVV